MNRTLEEYIKLAGTDTSGKWLSVDRVSELIELILDDCCKEIGDWKSEPFPFDESVAIDILKRRLEYLKKDKNIRVIRI